MPKIDRAHAPAASGTTYPSPFDIPCRERAWVRLGDPAGLTQFGVNEVTLPAGAWSSQRHWHADEDEFVYVLAGELVLVTDAGEEVLRPGDSAGFPAGSRDGHHLQNRTNAPARFLVVGSRRATDWGEYPDIDLVFTRDGHPRGRGYWHKDGRPY